MIQLPMQPGWVAVFIFVFFDITLLSLADVMISRTACVFYYRAINNAHPIHVSTIDLPGLTSQLVGSPKSPINIVAVIVKLALIIIVFFINLGISPIIRFPHIAAHRSSVFIFAPSERQWQSGTFPSVERRWARVQSCRQIHLQNNSISYYQVAFDLQDPHLQIDDEFVNSADDADKHLIRESSIVCLSPEFVKHPVPVIRVVGCSMTYGQSCTNNTMVFRPIVRIPDLARGYIDVQNGDMYVHPHRNFSISLRHYNATQVAATWPEYVNSSMTCIETFAGLSNHLQSFLPCLFVERNGTHTLVERWQVLPTSNESFSLARLYEGPLFEGDIDIGPLKRAAALENLVLQGDWAQLSGLIVGDAAVYKRGRTDFDQRLASKTSTNISLSVILLAIVMVLFLVAARVFLSICGGRHDRPPINTIDGLSSILREEHLPTAGSLVLRGPAMVGFTDRKNGNLHFGPINPSLQNECAPVRDGCTIE